MVWCQFTHSTNSYLLNLFQEIVKRLNLCDRTSLLRRRDWKQNYHPLCLIWFKPKVYFKIGFFFKIEIIELLKIVPLISIQFFFILLTLQSYLFYILISTENMLNLQFNPSLIQHNYFSILNSFNSNNSILRLPLTMLPAS